MLSHNPSVSSCVQYRTGHKIPTEYGKYGKKFSHFPIWKSLEKNLFSSVSMDKNIFSTFDLFTYIFIIVYSRLIILLILCYVNIIVPAFNLGTSFGEVKSRKGLEKVFKKSANLYSKLHSNPGSMLLKYWHNHSVFLRKRLANYAKSVFN